MINIQNPGFWSSEGVVATTVGSEAIGEEGRNAREAGGVICAKGEETGGAGRRVEGGGGDLGDLGDLEDLAFQSG